jgi:hypothetical protein
MLMLFKTGQIRPELKAYKIGFFLLDVVIVLGTLVAITGILIGAYLLTTRYCSDFWLILGLSVLFLFLNVIFYKKLRGPYLKKLLHASELISAGPGRPATLCFPGITGYSGLLLEVKGSSASGAKIIALGVPKNFKIPKDDLEVILRSDTTAQHTTVVVQVGERHFVGSAKDHTEMQQELSRMKLLLSTLLYLSFAAVVGLASYMYIENNRLTFEIARARASIHFPTTKAHIISSGVEETRIQKGKVKRTVWYPKVRYAYEIDNDYRTGERLIVADMVYYEKAAAQKIADHYPANSIHPLYYDPDDTAFTLLEPGNEDILINDRLVFLIKWSCILVAIIALALVFQLCRKKLLPKIEGLARKTAVV